MGTSPEQRKRSMPSSTREHEASGCLRFPPLWETSVWCVMCGVSCVFCVLCCVVFVGCGVMCVLCCVEVCCVVCGVLCSCSLFAPAVCYSKRGPNIKEYWERADARTRPKLSWGRLRSSENVAYRRAFAVLKTSAGLRFPPCARRLACPWWRWDCVSLGDVSGAAKTQHTFEPSRS